MMQQNKVKVLFLCTGNSARSQMAEGFLREYAGDQFAVYSAGLRPKGMNPFTVRAMGELGIDVSSQRSKSVKEYLGKENFRYIITVCSDAEEDCARAYPDALLKHIHWDHFEDPAAFKGSDEAKLTKFREVRDQIDQQIKTWLAELNIRVNFN